MAVSPISGAAHELGSGSPVAIKAYEIGVWKFTALVAMQCADPGR